MAVTKSCSFTEINQRLDIEAGVPYFFHRTLPGVTECLSQCMTLSASLSMIYSIYCTKQQTGDFLLKQDSCWTFEHCLIRSLGDGLLRGVESVRTGGRTGQSFPCTSSVIRSFNPNRLVALGVDTDMSMTCLSLE